MTASAANALELKLQCNYSTKITYTTGEVRNASGSGVVEVYDFENGTVFIVLGQATGALNSLAVKSLKDENTISVTNRSDSKKWDISHDAKGTTGVVLRFYKNIIIDRNTGSLFLRETFTQQDGEGSRVSSGSCEKIDTTTKKF